MGQSIRSGMQCAWRHRIIRMRSIRKIFLKQSAKKGKLTIQRPLIVSILNRKRKDWHIYGKINLHSGKTKCCKRVCKSFEIKCKNRDGYMESENAIVTWCVGHLVTMSYPEEYDPALKKWSLDTLPFIPDDFKYEVIPQVAKQFQIVSGLLTREDVDRIYVCTDQDVRENTFTGWLNRRLM